METTAKRGYTETFRFTDLRGQTDRYKICTYISVGSRHSVVGIATGYGLDDREVGVRVPVVLRIFSFPRCPDRLWCSPNLLSNGYGGSFLGGKAAVT
jgi:hypothetical protein